MKVGEIVVTCPACGESLSVEVQVHSVTSGFERLRVAFAEGSAAHRCEGRS